VQRGKENIMKRVKAACIQQTLHFMLKEDVPHEEAVRAVQAEYVHYKELLERRHTKYRIVEEQTQPDGSILVKIIKQYNAIDCGEYLS